ncbi:ABC transporter ATP-binding protein [Paraburkholderia nodosa]|uniref:ABC transporter ATP-binding protein n=1 Tax=Paraburkholderia nodosa TaxID=392320 RepID=UPI0004AF2BCB|nr:ABC transporter ATP-binding protein [Paraburkholderia nodosa]
MEKRSDDALRVEGLDAGYGRVKVIRDGAITVGHGEVVGLIGRNGAGKTTFISSVAGLVMPSAGRIELDGIDITTRSPSRRVAAGLALVPSGGRLFRSLTVAENLTIGVKTPTPGLLEGVFDLFPELHKLRLRYAGKLSGGERQMVAIARALMLEPHMLLLDEPSEGLAPVVVLRLAKAIDKLRAGGMAMLIAEQNAKFADLICQRWYSIDKGAIAPFGKEALGPEASVAAALSVQPLPNAFSSRKD